MASAAATAAAATRRRSRIGGQENAIAESRLEALDGAVLVSAAGAAAHADGADHLAVDDDGNSARDGEEAVLDDGAVQAARIVAQLRRPDGRRLTQPEGRLRFQHRSADVVGGLAVSALLVHELTRIV